MKFSIKTSFACSLERFLRDIDTDFLYKTFFLNQLFICLFIYLAVSGLSCSTRDLSLQLKESYMAQNSLELKLPSGSSPPFYAKQRTLSPEGKKWTLRLISPAPSRSSLWLSSRIPCPSHLRDNYSEQPWRRTGTLRLQLSTYMPIYTSSFLGSVQVRAAAHYLTAAPSRLIKGDLFL